MSSTDNLPNSAENPRAAHDAMLLSPEAEIIAAGENSEFWAEYSAQRRARRAERERADAHHGLWAKWAGKRQPKSQEEPETYQRHSIPVTAEEQEAVSASLEQQAEFWSQWAINEGVTSDAPKKSARPASLSETPTPTAKSEPPASEYEKPAPQFEPTPVAKQTSPAAGRISTRATPPSVLMSIESIQADIASDAATEASATPQTLTPQKDGQKETRHNSAPVRRPSFLAIGLALALVVALALIMARSARENSLPPRQGDDNGSVRVAPSPGESGQGARAAGH